MQLLYDLVKVAWALSLKVTEIFVQWPHKMRYIGMQTDSKHSLPFTTLDYVLSVLLFGHKSVHLEMSIINQILIQTIQF